MIDFFRTLFRPAPPSGATAKERLRLVLLSDHLSLAPDVVEALKRDLLAVISRYVEIDSDHADVSFEHREREVAMLASIPITGVRGRRSPLPAEPVVSERVAEEPVVSVPVAVVADTADTAESDGFVAEAESVELPLTAAIEDAELPPSAAPSTLAGATSANAARPRRRRRKKPGTGVQANRKPPGPPLGQPAAQA
jgi:cell division topological specificity factor